MGLEQNCCNYSLNNMSTLHYTLHPENDERCNAESKYIPSFIVKQKRDSCLIHITIYFNKSYVGLFLIPLILDMVIRLLGLGCTLHCKNTIIKSLYIH